MALMQGPQALSALLAGAGVASLRPPGADPLILGVKLDSRSVEPGDLFFALPGARHDGAAFSVEAIERGACAVIAGTARPAAIPAAIAWVEVADPRRATALVAREFHGRPDLALDLVGVTGTNGKTTVTYLVESIVRSAGRHAGRIGTVGYAHGSSTGPSSHTTPEAPELFRMLDMMRRAGVEIVACEVSSHALVLQRVAGARFAVAAFLNLGHDHLDFHRDQAAYFAAKATLIEGLAAGSTAVLPADDPLGQQLAQRTAADVLTWGRAPRADLRLTDEHSTLEGSSAVLETPAGRLPVRTFLLGRFNLDNVAAAAACALALGLPPESITAGVLALESVPGRVEHVVCGQPFAVLVDYAHTEAALDSLLSWLREAAAARLIVVFGCGGDRDTDKRFAMGRVAARWADQLVITNDNPRSEDPAAIAREIARGVGSVPDALARTTTLLDRRAAIRAALAHARSGDVVVVAGKGHEATQTVGSHVEPFDDRASVVELLRELGWGGGRHAHA